MLRQIWISNVQCLLEILLTKSDHIKDAKLFKIFLEFSQQTFRLELSKRRISCSSVWTSRRSFLRNWFLDSQVIAFQNVLVNQTFNSFQKKSGTRRVINELKFQLWGFGVYSTNSFHSQLHRLLSNSSSNWREEFSHNFLTKNLKSRHEFNGRFRNTNPDTNKDEIIVWSSTSH